MPYPEKATYTLLVKGCTFFIKRAADCDEWLLSYSAGHGHYHYRQSPTPKARAELLAARFQHGEDWHKLKERVPSLVFTAEPSDLTEWKASSELPI